MMSAPDRMDIMSDMGSFYVSVGIESLTRRTEQRVLDHVLVDTGSEFTWIPASLLEELGVEPEGLQRFIIADGRVLERRLGMAIVHAEGARAPDWVVFAEEGDMTLLGARSLEGMNLRVDARAKRLVPAGPIVTAAA
jgi:predicted aspartyl protease